MEFLGNFLPIVIYILLIGLLIIGIIIGIKLIITMNKVEKIVDDVDKKVQSLNGFFNAINFATNKLNSFYEKLISNVTNIVEKLFTKRKGEDEDYE